MSYKTILYEYEKNIGTIKLNRPERMNAVIEQMYLDLQDLLKQLKTDNEIRVLIITGSSFNKNGRIKQAFCAGADLKEHSSGKRTLKEKRDYIMLAHATTRMIYELPKPIIAAINGPARGAGAEMALNCDFVFMANEATIAFPETGLGTFVGGGVTSHLPKITGIMKAKELIYTGKVLDGIKAVQSGLAYKNYPVNELMDEVKVFAELLAQRAPISIEIAKTYIQNSNLKGIESVLDLETEAILKCMETEDWHEGIQAFMEKRVPVYKGK